MKHQWMAYVIVGLLSIGAGVAIAGLPNNVPVEATIVPPTTTEAPTPTAPTATLAPTTTPQPTDTAGTTGTTVKSTTTTIAALPDRADLIVGAANGAGIAGTAARGVATLTALGYANVKALDGSGVAPLTKIYYADGFEGVASRMAADLGLQADFIAPLADAPAVTNLPVDIQLLAYIGTDRAR